MNYLISTFIFFNVLLGLVGCKSELAIDALPVIIDADTANEIDDLFALVRAIDEPKLNLIGITSAQFHISPLASDSSVLESQKINQEIVSILGMTNIELPVGSNTPLSSSNEPAKSQASSFIVEKAHMYDSRNPLHLVILGSCTNVASAILEDPSIIPKIKVHYLGFWHEVDSNTYDKKEFNSGNDTFAVNVLLDTEGLDFDVMTATTSQHLIFDKSVVDIHLKGKGGIADLLVNRWETYERWWTKEDPEKLKWIMWDVAIIEALIRPELCTKELFFTPPENIQREIGIFTAIDVAAMSEDFWNHVNSL